MTRETMREMVAEFLGPFTPIVFDGRRRAGPAVASNERIVSLDQSRLGLAVAMDGYVAGGVSGVHLNPAVTLMLAVRRGFQWRKVLPQTGADGLLLFTRFHRIDIDVKERANFRMALR